MKTEIFPHTLTAEAEKIDLGIIVGGCVGGTALLLVVGVILGKVRKEIDLGIIIMVCSTDVCRGDFEEG